jgi:large conductance mechanosensitive channel
MFAGFKAFLTRGNVIDLAVGVIIGAAFGAIVDSLTKDIITPLIAMVGGAPDFSGFVLNKTVDAAGKVTGGIFLGNFLNSLINFLIKAAALYFMIVAPMNAMMSRMKKPDAPAAPAEPPAQEKLLGEIRDLLKGNSKAAGA